MDPKVHVPPQFPGASSDAGGSRASRNGSRLIGPWWIPVAGVWALVLALRHVLHDLGVLRSRRGALPTMVVGNVEVGGTGKTPHVLDLSRRLSALLGPGSVGILSRGY
ncbi:MAG: tetraacyldisaccharide 4'-kinase, partial [Flavobacteriales bacterium]